MLNLSQAPPLFPQSIFAAADACFLLLLLRQQISRLRIHLLALMLPLLDLAPRFLDLQLRLFFPGHERAEFGASLLDELSELAFALFQRLVLLLKGSGHLLFGGQGDFALSQPGIGAVALLAEAFQEHGQLANLRLQRLLA